MVRVGGKNVSQISVLCRENLGGHDADEKRIVLHIVPSKQRTARPAGVDVLRGDEKLAAVARVKNIVDPDVVFEDADVAVTKGANST